MDLIKQCRVKDKYINQRRLPNESYIPFTSTFIFKYTQNVLLHSYIAMKYMENGFKESMVATSRWMLMGGGVIMREKEGP